MKKTHLKISVIVIIGLIIIGFFVAFQAAKAPTPTIPDDWKNPFSDVSEKDWFLPYVADLNVRGIVSGDSDGRFGAADSVSAGEAIQMIMEAAGIELQNPAQEVPQSADYVTYAVEQGWLAEEIATDLHLKLSRKQVFQLTANALDLDPAAQRSPFSDMDDTDATALHQAHILYGSRGMGRPRCKPEEPLNRAELCTLVWRIMDYMERHIRFGNQVLDIMEDVPAFSYDKTAFSWNGKSVTYTGDGVEPCWGIDVSNYQGEIDWQAVAEDGVEFAIIRAGLRGYGTGAIKEDIRFHKNMQGAQSAGIDVGIYFFSQAITVEEASEEARFLLDMLKSYEISCPVVFDWEHIGVEEARTDHVNTKTLTEIANAFCQEIEEAGYQPMIYFNRHVGYMLYDLSGIMKYPFWLAEYAGIPSFYYDFQMWQYSNTGSVSGIKGAVDLNLWLKPIKET